MIANKILETKLINQYDKIYSIFAQDNVLKLNLNNDNIIQGLIQDAKGNNVNSTYKKEILTPYGTLSNGDYITHTYISNGVEKSINYICESEVDKEIGCEKFFLLQCPLSINIFDWNYSDIKTYPISLKNNTASLAIKESAIMITNNSSFEIIIKYDENTRSFVQGDNIINGVKHSLISRVLIDKMPFNRVGANHLINKGILVINIENGMPDQNYDNLDLQVADYWKHYIEPIDYNKLIDDEMLKYEVNANVPKTRLSNEIIIDIVKKLKYGQTANESVNVVVSEVGTNNLLTLNDGVVRLTSQLPFESEINTTTATLTFSAGGVSKTLLVNVTIEKQDIVITDEDIVIAEMPKYEITAFIGKDVIAGENISSLILKLKDGQIANPEVDTYISYVDTDNLLTLTGRVATLTDIIPATATDNETVANISFVKGEVLRTLSVFVTIEKQDEQSAPDLTITEDNGYEDLPIGETNTYTINTTDYVTWSITNVNGALTLDTTAGSNKCSVTCANATKHINKQETLTATVNGFNYTFIVLIVGLI